MILEYSEHKACQPCKEDLETKFKQGIKSGCSCSIDFNLKNDWDGDIYFYYGLSNFYQVSEAIALYVMVPGLRLMVRHQILFGQGLKTVALCV